MRKSLLIIFLAIILAVFSFGCVGDPIDEPIYFTDIYLGGSQLLIPAYAELYTTNTTTVNCTLANTFYPIVGISTTGETLGFTDNGFGILTYTDVTPNRICLITTAMTVSLTPVDRPAIVSAKIYKNGIEDPASLVGDYIGEDDVAGALPIVCLIELTNTGDYIEVYVASSKAGISIVVNTLTLIATTVD